MILSTLGFAIEAGAILVLLILGQRDRDRFASLTELLDRVMATRGARYTLLVFWWWLGWHFLFARTIDPGAA